MEFDTQLCVVEMQREVVGIQMIVDKWGGRRRRVFMRNVRGIVVDGMKWSVSCVRS